MASSKRLAIIGTGELGRQLAHHATASCGFALAGFFDDFAPDGSAVEGGGAVLGPLARAEALHRAGAFDELIVGVGYLRPAYRRAAFEGLGGRVPFARLVHPAAYVDPSAQIHEGAVVLAGCVLDQRVEVGPNALLHTGCVVAHGSAIGAHSFVGVGVRIAGEVRVGEGVFLGIGTTVSNNVAIGDRVETGAGTVVIRDLAAASLYVGVPARRVRATERG